MHCPAAAAISMPPQQDSGTFETKLPAPSSQAQARKLASNFENPVLPLAYHVWRLITSICNAHRLFLLVILSRL